MQNKAEWKTRNLDDQDYNRDINLYRRGEPERVVIYDERGLGIEDPYDPYARYHTYDNLR